MNAPLPEPPPLDYEPPADPFAPTDVDALLVSDRKTVEWALIAEVCQGHATDAVLAACTPEDFSYGSHKRLWEVICQLHADRTPVDLVSVMEFLEARGWVQDVGGQKAVLDMLTGFYYVASAQHLAERLAEISRRERLAQAGRLVAAKASGGDLDEDEVLGLIRPAMPTTDRGIEKPWDVIDRIIDRHANPERSDGVRLGWRTIDDIYRVAPGMLTVVTGTPNSGKSAWLDHAMVRLAERHGWRFALMSPEQGPTERHALLLTSIVANRNHRRLSEAELHEPLDWIHQHFTWIKSTDRTTVKEVMRRAEVIRRAEGINGLVIDPWNELDHTRPDGVTETQHISSSLTDIRRWSRRHQIHTWIVAHPRSQQTNGNANPKPPGMYDISGSATWHDKSDIGILVHRDKLKPGPVDVHVLKMRDAAQGRIGVGRLMFDVETGRYHDLAPDYRQDSL